MSKERELLERAYQYIPMSSVTSQEIRAYLADTNPSETINSQEVDRSEPVAWMVPSHNGGMRCYWKPREDGIPAYLHPAPRPEFVRLSEEEVTDILTSAYDMYGAICAVENRLVEKNSINKSDPNSIDLQSRCRGDKL